MGKEKKNKILSKEERRVVSYHEVGHALISALQKDSEPVQKITIVPRTMGALGYVMNVPEEEKYLNSEKEIRAMLVQYMGGRAAEEIVFDTVTTGASNDIERATQIARAMVTQYGMSEEFGLMALESIQNQYLSGRTVMNCSDITAAEIDAVVKRILKESYEQAKALLRDHRATMDQIAAFLIEKESITGAEFMEILRKIEGPKEEVKEELSSETEESAALLPTEENGTLLTEDNSDTKEDATVEISSEEIEEPQSVADEILTGSEDPLEALKKEHAAKTAEMPNDNEYIFNWEQDKK